MDIFAHGLWTNVVFYPKLAKEKTQRAVAILFGILPDLASFTPSTIYLIFHRVDFYSLWAELDKQPWVFKYAIASYNFTHSLVIFLFVFLAVIAIRRGRIYWPMLGWLLHILIDIPTHKHFFTTPFLYPFSGYRFTEGVSWGHPKFMLINYGLLAAVYLFWFLVLRRKREV